MKNKWAFALITFLSFTLLACKQSAKFCQLGKSYTTTGFSTVSPNVYLYNTDGNLIRLVYTNGNKDTLVYLADTLSILSYDNNETLLSIITGTVDQNRYFRTAVKTSYNANGSVNTVENYSLEHDAEGHLTKQILVNSSGTAVLSLNYSGGNSATAVQYQGTTLVNKYIFYHSVTENKTGIDDLNGSFAPYWGKPSNCLLDSIHQIVFPAGDTVRTQFAHSLDANGYISKTIETRLSGGATTKYHTYQYFNCR